MTELHHQETRQPMRSLLCDPVEPSPAQWPLPPITFDQSSSSLEPTRTNPSKALGRPSAQKYLSVAKLLETIQLLSGTHQHCSAVAPTDCTGVHTLLGRPQNAGTTLARAPYGHHVHSQGTKQTTLTQAHDTRNRKQCAGGIVGTIDGVYESFRRVQQYYLHFPGELCHIADKTHESCNTIPEEG